MNIDIVLYIIAIICWVADALNAPTPIKLFPLGWAFALAAFAF